MKRPNGVALLACQLFLLQWLFLRQQPPVKDLGISESENCAAPRQLFASVQHSRGASSCLSARQASRGTAALAWSAVREPGFLPFLLYGGKFGRRKEGV